MYFQKPIYRDLAPIFTWIHKNSYVENQLVYTQTKFSVSLRETTLWIELLDKNLWTTKPALKKSIKSCLLLLETDH